jgi:hypothetical protein
MQGKTFANTPPNSQVAAQGAPQGHRSRAAWMWGVAAAALWSCAACTGSIGEPSELQTGSGPFAAPGTGKDVSSPAGGTSKGAAGGGSVIPVAPPAANCGTAPLAAAAPLSRLTNLEYQNTLKALFPNLTLPDADLPSDVVVEGFDNNAKAQTPSPALIEQYRLSAQTVAAAVSANPSAVLPCQATGSAQEDSCGAQFIDTFVARAYRRPLTADERTRYVGFFSSAKSAYDFPTAIGMVVRATLQSPAFLYRVELGGPAKNGVAPLNGYELASRLSYFFWDTMPDDELLAAAKSGALQSAAGVEEQARRLLEDPQAKNAVSKLFKQWLRFDKMDRMPKNAGQFPDWNDQVADSLRSSTNLFVDRVFWDMDGSLRALLTDTSTFVDELTAPIYGLPKPVVAKADPTGMLLADTSMQQRSGILTQAGLLAAFAHETNDSPVLRGVFVMDRLLCSAPPPPPPGVTGAITETTQSGAPMTTRDRVAMTHESGTCAGCHHSIDGFGFGFSHYDAIGRWRDTENGLNVDARGWLTNPNGIETKYDGVVELGQALAKSDQVRDCVASQWFRYSLSLGAADVDSCSFAPVAKAFKDSDGNMQELMIATVTSDAFRNRPEVKP